MAKKTKSYSQVEATDYLEQLGQRGTSAPEFIYELLRVFAVFGVLCRIFSCLLIVPIKPHSSFNSLSAASSDVSPGSMPPPGNSLIYLSDLCVCTDNILLLRTTNAILRSLMPAPPYFDVYTWLQSIFLFLKMYIYKFIFSGYTIPKREYNIHCHHIITR